MQRKGKPFLSSRHIAQGVPLQIGIIFALYVSFDITQIIQIITSLKVTSYTASIQNFASYTAFSQSSVFYRIDIYRELKFWQISQCAT